MIKTACPSCSWSDEVSRDYLDQTVECPNCGSDFIVKDINESSSKKKKTLKVANSETRKRTANNKRTKKKKVVRLGAIKSLLIFQILTSVIMFVGLGIGAITWEAPDARQAEIAPIFGYVSFGIAVLFAVVFGLIYNGLNKRKKWAHNLATGFSVCCIFSPFFIWAIFAIKQLTQEHVQEAFGKEVDQAA